jgi:HD-GYP domain-containing protein (c-di-GMP phosphodiesterase class II)
LLAPELSLESRIIAVADVYGALSEDRPYRAGLGCEQIIAIMSKLVPRQLDGACFEALVSLMRHTPKVSPGSYSTDSQAERPLAAAEVAA